MALWLYARQGFELHANLQANVDTATVLVCWCSAGVIVISLFQYANIGKWKSQSDWSEDPVIIIIQPLHWKNI